MHNLHYNVCIFLKSGYVLYDILILGGENRGREVLTALWIEDCGAGGRAGSWQLPDFVYPLSLHFYFRLRELLIRILYMVGCSWPHSTSRVTRSRTARCTHTTAKKEKGNIHTGETDQGDPRWEVSSCVGEFMSFIFGPLRMFVCSCVIVIGLTVA